NFDRQDVVFFRARDHTCGMSSVWKSTTAQDIGTFYLAIILNANLRFCQLEKSTTWKTVR
ncbi:MAG: hypothetical protein KAI69_04625, partial [Deltaproteobacteria bacterium]|nr:hypothetical protein [Deltaproteobacteria bacterium]